MMPIRALLLSLLASGSFFAGPGVSAQPIPTVHGQTFIGIGYNIIDGNPEGGQGANGGADPGLLVSRRILELTYDNNKMSNDFEYSIPDETEFTHRRTTFSSRDVTTFSGTKSYAKKLGVQVKESVGVGTIFASVKFAASHRYGEVKTETVRNGNVFLAEQSTVNMGHMRYVTELAKADKYGLDRGFLAAACGLPALYDATKYMAFIGDWGTHVVTEIDLGTRTGTNYKMERNAFVKMAATEHSHSVSIEASTKFVSGALSVDMDKFNKDLSQEAKFGSQFSTYSIGSAELNEPISVSLIGMQEVFAADYWTKMAEYGDLCAADWDRVAVEGNMLQALKEYSDFRGIEIPPDDPVTIPLEWPDGRYGLPAVTVTTNTPECPDTDKLKFDKGSRYQKTDLQGGNTASAEHHMTDYIAQSAVWSYFCMKTVDKTSGWEWQKGSYCIYKYGDTCPTGFNDGYIKFDDEDEPGSEVKGNYHDGVLPQGTYNHNTIIYFCCREDGLTTSAIFLPVTKPFFLLQKYSHCQEVRGATVQQEWIEFTTEPDSNANEQVGQFPADGIVPGVSTTIRIRYCYYTPSPTAVVRGIGPGALLVDDENEINKEVEKEEASLLIALLRSMAIGKNND